MQQLLDLLLVERINSCVRLLIKILTAHSGNKTGIECIRNVP